MSTQTDREKIKNQQEGVYLTAQNISSAKDAVDAMHCRPFGPFLKTGSENAATNVAESPMGFVPHKSRLKKLGIQVAANIAADGTDYTLFKFYKRWNGTSTLIASWNTHTNAQGALTTASPGIISSLATGLVTNSDADIPADYGLTYEILKFGAGKAVNTLTVFSPWLEEI